MQGYCQPSADLVAILDAAPTPWLFLSTDGGAWLAMGHRSMPSLADVARAELRLAGLRIDAAHDAQHQLVYGEQLECVELESGAKTSIELPAGALLRGVRWSHDSERFVVHISSERGSELLLGLRGSAKLQRIAAGLNSVLTEGWTWLPDGKQLLLTLNPEDRGPLPTRPPVATAPQVLEAMGESTPLRTWPDLLKDEHDERTLEHFARTQLVLVDTRTGAQRFIGDPQLYTSVAVAPSGQQLLIERLIKPFSRTHLVHAFAHVIEVLDLDGRCAYTVAECPIAENIPIEGVRLGPRAVHWSPHAPAQLIWVEALDGGDPRRVVEHRDRWMELAAPYRQAPREFLRLQHRAGSLTWTDDPALCLARQYDRDRRWIHVGVYDCAQGELRSVLDDRSVGDHYSDPGVILTRPNGQGRRVLPLKSGWILRAGEGQSETEQRPFLAREELRTRKREELWRAPAGVHERLVAPLDDAGERFLTLRESPTEPTNVFLRSRTNAELRALTHYTDPAPILRRLQPRLERYNRADGVGLSGKLYLPPDWDGRPLPLVIWAYPEEYTDGGVASQTRASPHQFVRIHGASPLYFALRGYAVLDEASIPIVGHPEHANDTFVEQAVASVQAAIDHLASSGIADPQRVGVGGHSYGAFMTAVLLAHCQLFRAGIARSGAYNRTLTPFGFQHERRTLWEAKQSYVRLSPYLDAHQIRAPLLLIHGAQDPNPGTNPTQSERLFQALKGTGGRARYVVLPHESHAYRARESVLHVIWEMLEWFDTHVKG